MSHSRANHFLLVMTAYDRLGGYPVRLFLDTNPLVAISTALSTGTLYRALWWAIPIIILTIFLGRFFCGWICPFGTLHQLVGYGYHRRRSVRAKLQANRYRRGQALKYWLLVFLLAATVFPVLELTKGIFRWRQRKI